MSSQRCYVWVTAALYGCEHCCISLIMKVYNLPPPLFTKYYWLNVLSNIKYYLYNTSVCTPQCFLSNIHTEGSTRLEQPGINLPTFSSLMSCCITGATASNMFTDIRNRVRSRITFSFCNQSSSPCWPGGRMTFIRPGGCLYDPVLLTLKIITILIPASEQEVFG